MKNRWIEAEARRRKCKAVSLIALWRFEREMKAMQENLQKTLFDMLTGAWVDTEIEQGPVKPYDPFANTVEKFSEQIAAGVGIPKHMLLGMPRVVVVANTFKYGSSRTGERQTIHVCNNLPKEEK